MEKQELLHNMGKYFNTDKWDGEHTHAGSSYLHTYEKYLSHLREKKIKFLEIGVKDGSSHRMWSHYFSNDSTIYGLDIDPRCKNYEKHHQWKNIKIYIGSQDDQEVISQMAKDSKSGFDVILDDGSHVNELTIKSFNLLFPLLKPGGIYIIEDLGCSYLEDQLSSDIDRGAWPGMEYNKDVEFINRRQDIDSLFSAIIKEIDLKNNTQYEWIHFYSKIAIIKKREDI